MFGDTLEGSVARVVLVVVVFGALSYFGAPFAGCLLAVFVWVWSDPRL